MANVGHLSCKVKTVKTVLIVYGRAITPLKRSVNEIRPDSRFKAQTHQRSWDRPSLRMLQKMAELSFFSHVCVRGTVAGSNQYEACNPNEKQTPGARVRGRFNRAS